MAKRKISKLSAEIRKFAEENKLVIGTERTLTQLQHQKAAKIYISSNAPADVTSMLQRYEGDTEIVHVRQTNEELGVLCKKPYHVSVLSVKKE